MDGKRLREVVRIQATAAQCWTLIDGQYSGQGVDLFKLTYDRFLSVVYVWAAEHLEKDAREKWLAELDKPLEWERQQGAADIEVASDFDTPIGELEQLR